MSVKPNYSNSIVSVTNSLLKHYGAAPHHNTLPVLDSLLSQGYKNVVILVMDGLGTNVLKSNLPEDSFLRKHVYTEISSVYPCTTTAAITSILSGKTPAEHGWIGWSCYFSEINKCVDLFSSNESGTESPACEEHLPDKVLPFETIFSKIKNATDGNIKTCAVSPFSEYFANSMESICEHIKNLCDEPAKKFIYAYNYQPDREMHQFGVNAKCVKEMLLDYDKQLETLVNSLSDTLFLITADHGMTDITMKRIEDYEQIGNALMRHICVEPRCCSFYVKDEFIADFPKMFADTFGDKFILYNHDEFVQSGLLGEGTPHSKVNEFVGDYMAVAVSDIALWYDDIKGEYNDFKGAHAGLSNEEMNVPLIVVEK